VLQHSQPSALSVFYLTEEARNQYRDMLAIFDLLTKSFESTYVVRTTSLDYFLSQQRSLEHNCLV
jgi:hypothetical protein